MPENETKDERRKRLNRERGRRWRNRHPGAGAAASKKHRDKYGISTPWPAKRETGLRITKYKSETPCADCGGIFPPCCMDFDHLPGTKKLYAVGTMVSHGHSWPKIEVEIAKCELVCANCHRIRTQDRRTSD